MFNFDVEVYPVNSNSKLKAMASVVIEGVFEIKGWKIFEGSNGLFVSPPSREGKPKDDGSKQYFDDVVFREESERKNGGPVAQEIFAAILAKHTEVASGKSRKDAAASRTTGNATSDKPARPKTPVTTKPTW